MFGSRSGRSRNRSSSLGRCGGQVWWAGPVDGTCIRSSSRSGSRFGSRLVVGSVVGLVVGPVVASST